MSAAGIGSDEDDDEELVAHAAAVRRPAASVATMRGVGFTLAIR
jgi:hypothetical protein